VTAPSTDLAANSAADVRSAPMRGVGLRAVGVRKGFRHAGRRTEVLAAVDLEIEPGTTTLVRVEPLGGATTVVRCLGASYRVDAGEVLLTSPDGSVDLCRAEGRTVAWIRRHVVAIGDGELIAPPRRSARAVLERALRSNAGAPADRCADVLSRLGLAAIADEAVGRLGASDRALLATAVALLRSAPVVLLDEPFRAQAPETVRALADLIDDERASGAAVLLVASRPVPDTLTVDGVRSLSQGRITP
jgi:alpha-D-ribose 1-methylphosphonate 5-triphosphate synthase subunit PhnL